MKLQIFTKRRKIDPNEIGIMSWNPSTLCPEERMLLKMWRPVTPSMLDKLYLVSFQGVITSEKRQKSMKVVIQMLGFHRLLSFVKQTFDGKTRSRHATPLGDGRGIPKHFQDFGRFSKCSSECSSAFPSDFQDVGRFSKCSSRCSSAFPRPSLLAGFALRSKKQVNVFCSSDPSGNVTVLLVRGPDSSLTLVRTDITKMAQEEFPSVETLFSLVESMDFDSPMEDLSGSLMTDAELEANLPDGLLSSDPNHPSVTSSVTPPPCLPPRMPLGPPPPPSIPPPSPVLHLSSTSAPLQLRRLGPNTFEVVTDALQLPLNDLPLDLGYSSLPSTSSSSSSVPPPSPQSGTSRTSEITEEAQEQTEEETSEENPEETREERRLRLQAEACKRHRLNKKRKLKEEEKELEQLEKKNLQLRARLQAMEEMRDRWRSALIEVVARKRKRGKEEEEEDGSDRASSKSRKI